MKVTEKLIELGTNVFNGIKAEARLIGRAFHKSVRVVPQPDIKLPRAIPVEVAPWHQPVEIAIKQRDDQLIENGEVVFDRTGVADFMTCTLKGAEPLDINMRKVDRLVCRHMVDLAIRCRLEEEKTPGAHTKTLRNELFSTANIPTLKKMLLPLTTSGLQLRLNAPVMYHFPEHQFGECIADRLRKLGPNTTRHFPFIIGTHMVAVTLKHKNGGYSISVWDPNSPNQHLKAKLRDPRQALELKLTDFLPESDSLSLYLKNVNYDGPRFILYELPNNWPNKDENPPKEVFSVDYEYNRRTRFFYSEVVATYMEINESKD